MKILFFAFLLIVQTSLMALQERRNDVTMHDDTLLRQKMLREARLLIQEYRLLENKLKSWRIHKQKLIDRFERNNRVVAQMPLGEDDRYGKELAQKRKKAFYASLQKRESRIKSRLFEISKKLSQLKQEFYFRYAVELTEEEIFHGKAPHVKDKQQKINLLNDYIRYVESYQSLLVMNRRYDQAKSLMSSIAKINRKEENFEHNLTRRAAENRQKMHQYKMMAERLSEEFYNRYNLKITDLSMAQQFLENLKKSR